jgi:hypothetical protein
MHWQFCCGRWRWPRSPDNERKQGMADSGQEKAKAAMGKVVARAWRDPAFKAKLLSDPHGALKEAGVALPAGVTVKAVEDTDKQVHFVLPRRPQAQLSEAELEKLAAGAGGITTSGKKCTGNSMCTPV